MKILFLSEFFPAKEHGEITGGAESRTYYLSQELAGRHQVTVITSLSPGGIVKENWRAVQIVRVGPVRPYLQRGDFLSRFLFFLQVIKAALKIDFDIIDANSVPTYLAAWLVAKFKRKKAVFWVPDLIGFRAAVTHLGIINGLLEAGFEVFSIRFLIPDATVALSETTRDKLGRGVVIYPGVTPNSSGKKNYDVVCVNRLYQYKRTDLVVKAAKLLPDFKFVVVGEGEERTKLERIATKNVSFLGNLPHGQVLKTIASAKVFVLASQVEGFGIVTLEAMAAGLPFVNSNIPVHREIAVISKAGLLFKSGDPVDLAAKIKLLLKDKKLHAQLSKNALVFARKHTWDKMAKAYEDLFLN